MDAEKIKDSNADLYQLIDDQYLIDKFAHQFYETVDLYSDLINKTFELFNHVEECYNRLSSKYKKNEKILLNQIEYALNTLIGSIYFTRDLANDSPQKIIAIDTAFRELSKNLLNIFDNYINYILNPYTIRDTLELLNSIRQGRENHSLVEQSKKEIENERISQINLIKYQDPSGQIICENNNERQITAPPDPSFLPESLPKNVVVNQVPIQTELLPEIRPKNQFIDGLKLIPELAPENYPKNVFVNEVPMQK
ncbi:hypothetical protein TKK_0015798 [Trichogramma kaykai]|uniref:Uncharacterized protein n=1 Tax=Trichogramma kaykai TaxID=54128 RepID=A0ABD2W7Z2_9HYME